MTKKYEIRYGFNDKVKSVYTDDAEQAERIFDKAVHFIKQHELGGKVAIFNGGYLEKSFHNQ